MSIVEPINSELFTNNRIDNNIFKKHYGIGGIASVYTPNEISSSLYHNKFHDIQLNNNFIGFKTQMPPNDIDFSYRMPPAWDPVRAGIHIYKPKLNPPNFSS